MTMPWLKQGVFEQGKFEQGVFVGHGPLALGACSYSPLLVPWFVLLLSLPPSKTEGM